MVDSNIPLAKKARQMSEAFEIWERKELLSKISEAINRGTLQGSFFVDVYGEYDEVTEKYLKDQGYTVKHSGGTDAERDGRYWTIGW